MSPPLPKTNRRWAAGFSLLEVLVATTIMGLALVVLMQVFSGSLRGQAATQSQAQALMLADKVLSEYCTHKVPKPGRYQGQEGRFAYLVDIKRQYSLIDHRMEIPVVCVLLQVTVSWEERGQKRSLGLETIRTVAQKES